MATNLFRLTAVWAVRATVLIAMAGCKPTPDSAFAQQTVLTGTVLKELRITIKPKTTFFGALRAVDVVITNGSKVNTAIIRMEDSIGWAATSLVWKAEPIKLQDGSSRFVTGEIISLQQRIVSIPAQPALYREVETLLIPGAHKTLCFKPGQLIKPNVVVDEKKYYEIVLFPEIGLAWKSPAGVITDFDPWADRNVKSASPSDVSPYFEIGAWHLKIDDEPC